MFEGTLVESRGLEGTGTGRWTALGSLAVQCAAIGLVILLPLLRPQIMTLGRLTPPVVLPLLHRPPVVVQPATAAASGGAWSMPAASAPAAPTNAAVLTSLRPVVDSGDEPAPMFDGQMRMGGGNDGLLRSLAGAGSDLGKAVAVVRVREAGPVKVSQGVAVGMLLEPIRPIYPAIARAAGVTGTVVVEALISKRGKLESVQALGGPRMLQGAAVDAVSAARYRPYLLNGEPAEVKAMFTVVFSLGG